MIGLLLILLLAMMAGWLAVSLARPWMAEYRLKDRMTELIQTAPPLPDETLVREVTEYAATAGLPLPADAVTLIHYTDGSRELTVRWTVDVELYGAYTLRLAFTPTARGPAAGRPGA